MMIPPFPKIDLGLPIKYDPTAGNYKVEFIRYEKKYKRKIAIKSDGLFDSILKGLSKEAKKMLSKIPYPHEIIDAQVIFRPDLNTVGFKLSIRFENEKDWLQYKRGTP